jgi:hypothetical protein
MFLQAIFSCNGQGPYGPGLNSPLDIYLLAEISTFLCLWTSHLYFFFSFPSCHLFIVKIHIIDNLVAMNLLPQNTYITTFYIEFDEVD